VGLTRSAATAAIAAAGLTVGTVTPLNSCELTPDTVQLQVPLGGTAVAKGSAVNMKVATCVVPNVIGLTQSAAVGVLSGAAIGLGTVSTMNNCVNPGTVQVQSPSAGTAVAPGSVVNIAISTCVVPDMTGDSVATATAKLTSAGLRRGAVRSVNTCVDATTVQEASPSMGTAVAPGTAGGLTNSSSDGGGISR